jgi:hypothetical protein
MLYIKKGVFRNFITTLAATKTIKISKVINDNPTKAIVMITFKFNPISRLAALYIITKNLITDIDAFLNT